MTKEQEDAVNRANVVSQAMFSNLGFFQELAKQENKSNLDLNGTFKLVKDRATGLNTEVTLGQYLKDFELPEDQRKYDVAKDYTQPFIAYDNIVGENKFFTTYEEFAVANNQEPGRYGDKRDFRAKDWKKVIIVHGHAASQNAKTEITGSFAKLIGTGSANTSILDVIVISEK